MAGPGRRNVHEGIQKVDAPGQCRQNFSRCKAAELEQCVSVVGHPPGSGGPGGAAGGGQEVAPRFPSMLVSLHRGLFWYYLEQVKELPAVRLDGACPLIHMTSRELRTCALRVLYYDNRIAVEFFHAITDGNGGLVFLKTLTAAYVTLCSGKAVRPEQGVLDWHAPPGPGGAGG